MTEPARQYDVVVNGAGEYSIWPHGRELPSGWEREGTSGDEETCAAHIERVWHGLDPASIAARRA